MAYDVNTDYSAKNAELQKALAAATDAQTKAAIQAQIDANTGSRTEKMASDLTKYGKYATDSELNSAAGIMANNQLGTGYETQKANLNTSYDTAKQNANNDALSRGMARSSFVSDRMANLDSERSNALTQVDASKALALQNAKTSIIDNYRTNTANALTAEKSEFADTIGAYSDNYQAEINKVTNDGDTSNDWKVPYLNQARNAKIEAQKAAALKAAKGSGGGSSSGTTKPNLTAAQALAAYDTAGIRTPEVVAAYTYYYGDPDYDPNAQPTYSTPRTATYGSSTVSDVNDRLNAGYTPQEVMAAAAQKYGTSSKEYQNIVSAALRQR